MSGLCKNCKWWEAPSDMEDGEGGVCALTAEHGGGGYKTTPWSKAVSYVDASHKAPTVLLTDPDFGCVQFTGND